MALSLVQNHFGSRSDAAYFYAIREVVPMRKLKKYKPTRFMAKTSHYDKDAADYAVMFIESLCHTKGTRRKHQALQITGTISILKPQVGGR